MAESASSYKGFPPPIPIADGKYYGFKPDNKAATSHPTVLLASEVNQLVEKYNLTHVFNKYKKDFRPNPSMYSLVSHLPSIPVLMDTLFPGEGISIDGERNYLQSTSVGGAVMRLELGGNLVIYINERQVWESGTSGLGGVRLELRDTGKLELLNEKGSNVWSVEPEDPALLKPVKCQLRYDGNLIVVDKRNSIVWDSKSGDPKLTEAAMKYDRQSWLYSLIEVPNMSNRALEPLSQSKLTEVFKLEPGSLDVALGRTTGGVRKQQENDPHRKEQGRTMGNRAEHDTGASDGVGTGAGMEEHTRKKHRKEKKEKSEKSKKKKKEKSSHRHRHDGRHSHD
eukprot:CFRG7727T1